jgi:hypothetical protein
MSHHKPVNISEEDLQFWTKNAAHPLKFQEALTKLKQMQKEMPSMIIHSVWEVDGTISVRPANPNAAVRRRSRR